MSDKKHNGWTNYQTWNFKTWMENDENDYRTILSKVEKALKELYGEKDTMRMYAYMPVHTKMKRKFMQNQFQNLKYRKASTIIENYAWEWVDNVVSTKASFVNDVLRYAINGINFYEIAEDIVDRVEEEIEVV